MSSEIINYLRKSNNDSAILNALIAKFHEMNPEIKGDAKKGFVAFTPQVKLRTTTSTISGADIINSDTKIRETTHMIRKKPIPVKGYELDHTTTNSLSFIENSHKLGGNGKFSGASYITVNSHDNLNVTDEISLGLWIKPPTISVDGLIISKNNQYQLKLINSDKIQFRVYSGGWKTAIEYDYTPDVWVHIMASYKSTGSGQKLYANNVLVDSDSETGVIGTSSNDLKIGGDGSDNVPNNTYMAWLTILHKEISTTWLNNLYTKNQLDTSDGNDEILTIPFIGTENPQPDAFSGLCQG